MIREIKKADFEQFWPTFSAVIQAQETYAFLLEHERRPIIGVLYWPPVKMPRSLVFFS
ncbi:hypothetical protein VINE108274_22730 [Vibrio neptunius]